MIKKRRYRRRRYRKGYIKMYRYRKNRSKKPEVKYIRWIGQSSGAAFQIRNETDSSQLLRNETIILNNTEDTGLLAGIAQGTQLGQRIGNKIFAKFMTIKGQMWVCPPDAQTQFLADVPVRILVHNARMRLGGANMSDFWGSPQINKTIDWVNRTDYIVFKDKTFVMKPMGNVMNGTTKGYQTPGMINFFMKVPINRQITYDYTGDIKDQKNIINISMVAYNPLVPQYYQLGCAQACATIYYTDS